MDENQNLLLLQLFHCRYVCLVVDVLNLINWLGCFFLYCIFASWKAPQPTSIFMGINVANFYIWKVLFIWMCFYLGFEIVSNSELNIKNILNLMVIAGAVMSMYCILQYFHCDQFFDVVKDSNLAKHRVAGFLGNSNLVAPYIGMIFPLAIHSKKYFVAFIIMVAVILTNSLVGIGSLIVTALFIIGYRFKKVSVPVYLIIILSILVLAYDYLYPIFGKRIFDDSGRIQHWIAALIQLKEPFVNGKTYLCTGFGLGSFRFMYHAMSPIGVNNILEAHNEYIEVLYEIGIFGFILLSYVVFSIIKHIRINRLNYLVVASVIFVIIASGGLFALHNGAIAFNTMILLGILNNKQFAL